MSDDVRALRTYVAEHLGDELIKWPGGRPGEAEVALVDAVMSIRARYGRGGDAPTGVHRAVAAYRRLRGTRPLDDLGALAALDPAVLARSVGSQRTGGVLKAEAIVRAAAALVAAGAAHADRLRIDDYRQKRAYTSVQGLGWVTWEYVGMLLGQPGVKADRWVVQAVARAVGRRVTAAEAREIVLATAEDMDENATRLEHALWAFERSRRGATGDAARG